MQEPRVTVVIPTLTAGAALQDCVRSLAMQTFRSFETIVVDNSGRSLARAAVGTAPGLRIIENHANVGFGSAINQAAALGRSEYLATLNDDARAASTWLAAMMERMDRAEGCGMCAPQVRLNEREIDSAGMLIGGDGSSKQRGHLDQPGKWSHAGDTLAPSGSAALYRRTAFEQAGGFDDSFFLYCEDTDLALRIRRLGWSCLYEPEAIVEHGYSQSAGRASPLKAFYVERNRLYLVLKNFPVRLLWRAPFYTLARYGWHVIDLVNGGGAASRYRAEGHSAAKLIWFVIKAHAYAVARLGKLLAERRRIHATARITDAEYTRLLRANWIGARQVASL